MMNAWTPTTRSEPGRRAATGSRRPRTPRSAVPRSMTTRYSPEDRQHPDQPQLLAQARRTGSRCGSPGIPARLARPRSSAGPAPNPVPSSPPPPEGVERVDDLVSPLVWGDANGSIQTSTRDRGRAGSSWYMKNAPTRNRHDPQADVAEPARRRVGQHQEHLRRTGSAAPRSRWTTTMPRAIAHIATIGARYGSGGNRDWGRP
jgi:hypothetical protein